MQHRIILILQWRKIQLSQFVEMTWWDSCKHGRAIALGNTWGKGGSFMVVHTLCCCSRYRRVAMREGRQPTEEGSACYGMGTRNRRHHGQKWKPLAVGLHPDCFIWGRSPGTQLCLQNSSRLWQNSDTHFPREVHPPPLQTMEGCCLGASSRTSEEEKDEHQTDIMYMIW